MIKFNKEPKLDAVEKEWVLETLKPLLKQNKILKARAILGEIYNDSSVNIIDFLLYHLQDTYFKDSEEIFEYEFHNSKLVSIDIPSNITSIYDHAFSECKQLESVSIPDGVTEIAHDTFWGCKHLESVTIPKSVKYIEGLAFCKCDSLKQVSVPKNTKIDIGAFDKHITINRY